MKLRLRNTYGYALTALLTTAFAAPAMSQPPSGARGPRRPPMANAPQAGGGIRMPGERRLRPAPGSGAVPQPAPATPAAASAAPATATGTPAAPPSTLQVVPGKSGDKIAMDIYGLDIDYLLRLLMKAAKVTIIKSDAVSGPVTIIAPEEVPLDVAFQIVNQALAVRKFTMVRTSTGVYKVIPMAEAAQAGAPIRFGANPEDVPPGDELITQVVPLRNLSANDVSSLLAPWKSEWTKMQATSTNSLIITDTASNLANMLAIISHMEDELSGGYHVYYLQYYDASQMADLVNSAVLGRGGGTAAAPRPAYERRVVGQGAVGGAAAMQQRAAQAAASAGVVTASEVCLPDTRMNSLIVLATPVHQQQIANLIQQLDQPISLRDTYFIYPVQNLVASDLAAMVGQLVGAEVKTPAATQATRTTTGAAARTTAGRTQTTSQYRGGLGSSYGYGGSRVLPYAAPEEGTGRPDREVPGGEARGLEVQPMAGEAAPRPSVEPLAGGPAQGPQAAAAQAPLMIAQAPAVLPPGFVSAQPAPQLWPMPFPSPAAQAAGEAETYTPGVYGQASITADDNTNTIMVSASPEQLDLIRQLLEKLDVMPPQVHIQAIIAEVALTRDNSLGVQFSGLQSIFNLLPFDQRDAANPRLFEGTFNTNLGVSATDAQKNPTPGLTGVIVGPEGFQAVLSALTTDSHARILSTPSIFTSNNQEGRIDVSSQRPFPRGILTGTTTGGGISTSIDYQSVGITLTVTPRVTQGDMVQMDVIVTADEPGASVLVGDQEFPSINKRETDATVSIKNGHTVIMGGLMRDTITRSGSRVPILGDLPVIGSLFSSTKSKREKSELLVFLTPRVVRNPAEAARVTEGVRAKLQEVPKSLQGSTEGPQPEQGEGTKAGR
jgi:type II secretion system protein D